MITFGSTEKYLTSLKLFLIINTGLENQDDIA